MAITLKAARVNAGLTQKEASKKLNLSQKTLAGYENGQKLPRVDTVKCMEDLYHVDFEDLIFMPSTTI